MPRKPRFDSPGLGDKPKPEWVKFAERFNAEQLDKRHGLDFSYAVAVRQSVYEGMKAAPHVTADRGMTRALEMLTQRPAGWPDRRAMSAANYANQMLGDSWEPA